MLTTQPSRTLQELDGSSDDEDEPGGLHIGGIVIRAPARSRTAEHPGRTPRGAATAAPGGSSRAVHTCAQPQQLQQQELEQLFASEDSLDDELRDYLDNVKQVGRHQHLFSWCSGWLQHSSAPQQVWVTDVRPRIFWQHSCLNVCRSLMQLRLFLGARVLAVTNLVSKLNTEDTPCCPAAA
jgi:hypothetical protein